MKDIIEKLIEIEKEIVAEKGDLKLFAFVLREDAADYWDLLVSAAWVGENNKMALDYIADKLKAKLTINELIKISRVVFMNNDYFEGSIGEVSGGIEENNIDFYGIPAKKVYSIVSPISDFHIEKAA